MTRGHGWSLSITMRGTFTPYSLPAFTGAFDLTPFLRGKLSHVGFNHKSRFDPVSQTPFRTFSIVSIIQFQDTTFINRRFCG